ncbi:MAG: archease [Desulfuromonadales bacterium]|nr:archease [Desulfuromonadales bacterium]
MIEHTADMGIEVSADSQAELFIQAARGLREILSASEAVPREERKVQVTGGDAAELLVKWLNEILFLFETDGFFPIEFAVEEITEEYHLRGRIKGEPFDPERHSIEREIKSVTYHQLRVEKQDGLWHARIFVDL